jgi:tRNA G46 methylase TrmB
MFINPRLFVLPSNEIKQIGLQNLTYGSLSMKGLATTVKTLHKYCKEPIRGFDLGCGDGELIWHLAQALPDSTWEGVEISEHRVDEQMRDVCIWQGDMLTENFRPYNVLHADNLCLDDDVANKLEEKIVNEFKGIYITYRTPSNMKFLKKAWRLETVLTETTWTEHFIHYYVI